ncbi:MAG: tRNA (adenosine(37)-N6)-dimethylallyltransferase MiaA [Campylobacterota bacterium]|nr:tRNA (adenosine(37)-N6)-dimethylallyltransferase MiaA [Campylobacterota bacterium]
MKTVAIVGPTASGKSDAALELALKTNSYILSIDSLSIYNEIDIASAKPSKDELNLVKHFGINELNINEHFSVSTFIEIYEKAKSRALEDKKGLIIVGGTSFYLKTLMDGLSEIPKISDETKEKASEMLENLDEVYALLKSVDETLHVEPTDRYRLEKALLIYLQTKMSSKSWFELHPPKPIIRDVDVYNIEISRDVLKQRIILRTNKMVEMGLIDEVAHLERLYGRVPNAMKAIGVIEVLEYLDNKISFEMMVEKIITHTSQLAKRQQTFNSTQFRGIVTLPKTENPTS